MNAPRGPHRTTTELLHEIIDAGEGEHIVLDDVLVPLRSRAFGILLLVFAIPNFIPAPIGIGGVMGLLVIALGLQMLSGLEHPLVPARLRRKTLRRTRAKRFLTSAAKVTGWLERGCRPRLERLTRRPGSMVSGLALVIIGALLALPIPFTNYPFGAVLVAFAFALLERDGALLLGLWLLALALLAASFAFSHYLLAMLHQFL